MNNEKKTECFSFRLTPSDAAAFRAIVNFFGGDTSKAVVIMTGLVAKVLFDFSKRFGGPL